MATYGTDYGVPAEDEVTNTTAEGDCEEDETVKRHCQQHDDESSSELDSENQCADELLYVARLEHGRGWGCFQAIGLGGAVMSGVYSAGLANESPIVLPPEAAYSLDKRNQHEHTNDGERERHFGANMPLATDETSIDGVPVPDHGCLTT